MTTGLINVFHLYDVSYFEFYHIWHIIYTKINSVHFCLYFVRFEKAGALN